MVKQTAGLLMLLSIAAFMVAGCSDQNQPNSSQATQSTVILTDSDPVLGKSIYTSKCAACHGQGGTGSNQGPPLVHKIYKPGHHADYSFYRAVASGVRSHHWSFGNMPAIAGVSPESVAHIIAYIRQQQRMAGIE